MNQASLFPETQESIAARVDAEILELLIGRPGGALGMTLDSVEKKVLTPLRFRRGVDRAINIRELQEMTHLKPRSIKDVIRGLRMNFGLPIGSSKRAQNGGYYLMMTAEDEAVWINDVLSQARAEFAVLRAVVRRRESLEMLGQLEMVLVKEESQ